MSLLSSLFRRSTSSFGGGYDTDVSRLPPLGHDGPKTLMAIMAHPDDIDFLGTRSQSSNEDVFRASVISSSEPPSM